MAFEIEQLPFPVPVLSDGYGPLVWTDRLRWWVGDAPPTNEDLPNIGDFVCRRPVNGKSVRYLQLGYRISEQITDYEAKSATDDYGVEWHQRG